MISALAASPRVSGETLARSVGISRQALHKQILSLRKMGYEILGRPKAGYRLASEPDRILASRVLNGLKTKFMGKNLIVAEKTDSTQSEAKALAEKGLSEGTTVLAEEQSNGKGRMGRSWESGRGGLWFSVILRPSLPPQKAPLIALVSSLAVARAIESTVKVRCFLKWPNDILVKISKKGHRKICGSLIEMSSEPDRIVWAALGVGIDVNNALPKSLESVGISLNKITGKRIDRTLLFRSVLENLEGTYKKLLRGGFKNLKKEYVRRSLIRKGDKVVLDDSASRVRGNFVRFDPDGSIVLSMPDGERRNFYAGDVTL